MTISLVEGGSDENCPQRLVLQHLDKLNQNYLHAHNDSSGWEYVF